MSPGHEPAPMAYLHTCIPTYSSTGRAGGTFGARTDQVYESCLPSGFQRLLEGGQDGEDWAGQRLRWHGADTAEGRMGWRRPGCLSVHKVCEAGDSCSDINGLTEFETWPEA